MEKSKKKLDEHDKLGAAMSTNNTAQANLAAGRQPFSRL